MPKEINIMRLTSPKMVAGLVALCADISAHFKDRPITIVEVGSYIGESTQIFLNHLHIEKLHCVDKWDVTDKYDASEISQAETVFNLLHSTNPKVTIHKTHSRDEALKNLRPDFVYIDASHRYEDVAADIDFWLPLVKKGGIIAGHDYAHKFLGVIKAVDERFAFKKIYADTSWAVPV